MSTASAFVQHKQKRTLLHPPPPQTKQQIN